MKTARLTELPVKHLEYVFSPPGLPLPEKGETDIGTTSILVRGGAGSGKTTFALALAHAIAKAGGGLVLFVATEFYPIEIAFKATLVGLSQDIVGVWPGEADAKPGGVVVEHLTALRESSPVLSSAERRRSSIDAVWGRLHPEKEGEKVPALPVRAVVIDALTLPEPGEGEAAQRADLVAFMQALENEGISMVLVEELAQGAAAWSAFVVDMVFDLAFVPDVETQELRRKLTLSKCRYAVSIPGPHDYGLEDDVLSVWPDLFRVVTGGHGGTGLESVARVVPPPQMYVPIGLEERWAKLRSNIVLSPYDQQQMRAIRVFKHTPGIRLLEVDCGAETRVEDFSVYDNEGPHAIGWVVLDIVRRKPAPNVCVFNNLERLLSRPGWAMPVVHLLEGLRQSGMLVCIHSSSATMAPVFAVADYIWGAHPPKPILRFPRRHRRLVRQCIGATWVKQPAFVAEQPRLLEAMDGDSLRSAHGRIVQSMSNVRGFDKLFLWALHEWGGAQIRDYATALAGVPSHETAWFALHTGADWYAARAGLAAVEADAFPSPIMLLLWSAICAAIAQNPVAIDELKARLSSADEPLVLDPLLRGLAGTGQLDEADRIIADVGARHALAPWMLERMRADTRLDASGTALRDAARRLQKLTRDESLPLIHRAETWHNLGTARDRLGQREAAFAAFEHATALNHNLEAASEELERLRTPPKPASS